MQKYRFLILLFSGLFCLFSSCIKPFDPVGVKDTAGILVVEGMILEEGSTIKLSRTVKLDEKINESSQVSIANVDHATVHLIDKENNTIAAAEPQIINDVLIPGTYVIHGNIAFTPGMEYALDIKIGNKHYRSAFVAPVHTPEIDEVTWKLNDDFSLDIMVSTHDQENKTNYLRWMFDEDWEIRAPYYATHRYEQATGEIIAHAIHNSNNRYYCWGKDQSKTIVLGSFDKFTEAVIKNKPIHHIPANDFRLFYLYSILVKQYGIDKEAYVYFENLRKNVEESSSLFSPQPTEKKGNIQCLSDPDEYVVGYVIISKEVTCRIFINANVIVPRDFSCEGDPGIAPIAEIDRVYRLGGAIYMYGGDNNFTFFPLQCVDCTALKGTKNKPDFWPNDHQ